MLVFSEEETSEFWETSKPCSLDIGEQWKGKIPSTIFRL